MRWLAAVAVAAIVGLLVLVPRERAPERAPRGADGATAPVAAPDRAVAAENEDIVISEALGGRGAPAEDVPEPAENEPAPEQRADPPWIDEPRQAPAPDREEPVEVSGTLRVEGEAGAPGGTFRLVWKGRGGFDHDTIEVRAGAWSATVPSGSTLDFKDIRLGGRLAVALESDVPLPASGRMAVACRWFAPTALRVVDAESGTALAAVEIVRFEEEEWLHDDAIHPGPPSAGRARPVVSDAASPVTLPEEPGRQIYWVRAPEHAWTRVEVEQSFGGERVVRLPKAGGLDVRLSNFDPDSGAEVRLYEVDGGHLLSWPPKARPRIGALAPGKYRVRVEVGYWFRQPLLLGEALAEVDAGVVTAVAIELRDPPRPERLVPLAGTLHVDPGWGGEERIHLSVDGVDATGTDDPEAELSAENGRWSAGLVPPGRYAIHVQPWTWCQIVDVGPSGDRDVRIVVPPPCDVEVRVLEADRDEAAPLDTLSWHMQRPGGGSAITEEALAPGRFRFRAPVGAIELDGWGGLDVEERVVELKPGLNRITLRARRLYGFTIELEDAATGTKVPMDDGFCARVTVAGIDDPECRSDGSYSASGSTGTIGVTKPGRYRVMFLAEIDGFRSIDDQEVDVPAEGTARLVVRLRRR